MQNPSGTKEEAYQHSQHHRAFLKEHQAIPDISQRIKKVLDPQGLLSPGRYTL